MSDEWNREIGRKEGDRKKKKNQTKSNKTFVRYGVSDSKRLRWVASPREGRKAFRPFSSDGVCFEGGDDDQRNVEALRRVIISLEAGSFFI